MKSSTHPAPHPLHTDRLTLTDFVDADFAPYYAIDLDPRVTPYVGNGLPETRSLDEYCQAERTRFSAWIGGYFHLWTLRGRNDSRVLGRVMLRPVAGASHVEVGYRLTHSSWGKGYATEATRAVLDYGFNVAGFDELTAVTHPDNAASQHVLTKAGLMRDGTLNYNGGGEIPFFRLTKSDYEKL